MCSKQEVYIILYQTDASVDMVMFLTRAVTMNLRKAVELEDNRPLQVCRG